MDRHQATKLWQKCDINKEKVYIKMTRVRILIIKIGLAIKKKSNNSRTVFLKVGSLDALLNT